MKTSLIHRTEVDVHLMRCPDFRDIGQQGVLYSVPSSNFRV